MTMATQSGKSQSSGSSLTSISVKNVVRGHHVFKQVYLQVKEFNHCDCYTVAIMVDAAIVSGMLEFSLPPILLPHGRAEIRKLSRN